MEKRYGIALVAIIIGSVLFLIATIFVAPRITVIPHTLSSDYQQLSVRPFDFSQNNNVQYRILAPLLAHILFLRGALFPLFPLLMAIALIATVYWYFRASTSPLTSLAAAGIIAFSGPVLNSFEFVGFPDTLAYLLFWVCLISNNLAVQSLTFGLALFNHDNALFALPFLLWRPWTHESVRKTALRIILFLLMFVPVLVYRRYVDAHASPRLNPSFYLNINSIVENLKIVARYAALGGFEAFRLFWFLLLAAFWLLVRSRRWAEAGWLVLVVFSACAQLILAFDISRYVALAFPAILYSVRFLRSCYDEAKYEKILWSLFAANFLVPVYFIWEYHVGFHLPWPVILLLKMAGMDGWKI